MEDTILRGMTLEESIFLDSLYRQMFEQLYRAAIKILRDPSLAEETVQDTFVTAGKRIDVLMNHPNPCAWLMSTMRFIAINMRRRQAKMNTYFVSMMAQNMDIASPDSPFDGEIDLDTSCAELVGEENYRLFKAVTLKTMTILEASQLLGISLEACKKRMQRIRKKLREKMFD